MSASGHGRHSPRECVASFEKKDHSGSDSAPGPWPSGRVPEGHPPRGKNGPIGWPFVRARRATHTQSLRHAMPLTIVRVVRRVHRPPSAPAPSQGIRDSSATGAPRLLSARVGAEVPPVRRCTPASSASSSPRGNCARTAASAETSRSVSASPPDVRGHDPLPAVPSSGRRPSNSADSFGRPSVCAAAWSHRSSSEPSMARVFRTRGMR